ncbi:MAG TPA: YciI family protein [Symbiobacteriaceae bacterium]|nr:YciI family protein [Symbiobacteriaceae bacterium]
MQPTRPNFLEECTPEEESIMGEHFTYLKELLAKGQLLMAGPCEDAAFGIVVFEAESLDSAEAIMHSDPAVAKGVMSAELHPFRVSLKKER